jgi:hypothetical protein
VEGPFLLPRRQEEVPRLRRPLGGFALSALFDKVVWYSPYSYERQVVPNYQSGAQIRKAVREARRVLGLCQDWRLLVLIRTAPPSAVD